MVSCPLSNLWFFVSVAEIRSVLRNVDWLVNWDFVLMFHISISACVMIILVYRFKVYQHLWRFVQVFTQEVNRLIHFVAIPCLLFWWDTYSVNGSLTWREILFYFPLIVIFGNIAPKYVTHWINVIIAMPVEIDFIVVFKVWFWIEIWLALSCLKLIITVLWLDHTTWGV